MGFEKMQLQTKSRQFQWEVLTDDGAKHTICCKLLQSTMRQPIDVFVDEKLVETIQYSGKSIWPTMQHKISCGGENLLLVIHGNRMDLVQKGQLVHSHIKYDTTQVLSMLHRVLLTAVSFCSLVPSVFIVHNIMPEFMILTFWLSLMVCLSCGTLLMQLLSTSPFYTKEQKNARTFFLVLGVWALNLLVALFIGPIMKYLLSNI